MPRKKTKTDLNPTDSTTAASTAGAVGAQTAIALTAFDAKRLLEAQGHRFQHVRPINPDAGHDDLKCWRMDGGEPISKNELLALALAGSEPAGAEPAGAEPELPASQPQPPDPARTPDPVGATPIGAAIPIDLIDPNPHQPRQDFDQAKLDELAASIKENGLIQPVIIHPNGSDRYTLHAGERRLRACKLLGWTEIPAFVVIDGADAQALLIRAVVENVQRADMNPLEEAKAYQAMRDEFGMTDEQIGQQVGKSRSTVANLRRLLNLPEERQQQVATGELNERQAAALLPVYSLPGPVQEKLTKHWQSTGVMSSPQEYKSDQIRAKLSHALGQITAEIKLFTADEELTGPGVLQAKCVECEFYVKIGNEFFCTDEVCNRAKRDAWRRRALEQATAASGLEAVDPAATLTYGQKTDFFPDSPVLARALETQCPHLRLFCNTYESSRLARPEGASNCIHYICLHPKRSASSCTCQQVVNQAKVQKEKADKEAVAAIKKQVVDALTEAVQKSELVVLAAIALHLGGYNLAHEIKSKTTDAAFLAKTIVKELVSRNIYTNSYDAPEAYRKRVDRWLAEIGLALDNAAPGAARVADLDARLIRIYDWVKELRHVTPTPEQVAGNLANLAKLANEAQQLQDAGADADRAALAERKIFTGIDQLKTALLQIQPLVEVASCIEVEFVSWLVTVPSGDINFTSNLKSVTQPATLEYALALLPLFGGGKTARKAIERRMRAVERAAEKSEPRDPVVISSLEKGEPDKLELEPCRGCGGPVRYFVRLPGRQYSGHKCEQCGRVWEGTAFSEATKRKRAASEPGTIATPGEPTAKLPDLDTLKAELAEIEDWLVEQSKSATYQELAQKQTTLKRMAVGVTGLSDSALAERIKETVALAAGMLRARIGGTAEAPPDRDQTAIEAAPKASDNQKAGSQQIQPTQEVETERAN